MSRALFRLLLVTALAGCAQGIHDVPASATVDIPGATFPMGTITACRDAVCGADKLPHPVTVKPFKIDATEVSLVQFTSCIGQGKCGAIDTAWDFDLRNRPVTVTIDKARQYCGAVGGRLPTEAEWELAARSTKTGAFQAFPWGESTVGCDKLVSGDCPGGDVVDVGTNAIDVTPLGVHDLGGNRPEWVEDDYTPAPGCLGETPFETVCNGDANCGAQRCSGATRGNCRSGCALAVPTRAGTNFCEVAGDAIVEPLHRTRMALPLFKGGGIGLPACATEAASRSAYDLRPRELRPLVGFRCAFDPSGQAPPSVRATERIRLPRKLDCATLVVEAVAGAALSADDIAHLAVGLETEDQHYPATTGGSTLTFACTGAPHNPLLIVGNAPAVSFQLKISFSDETGACQSAVVGVDLSAGELPLAVARENVAFSGCPAP